MITSLDAKKAFDKIQNPFVIKVLKRLGVQGTNLSRMKAVYSKPIVNINLNGGKCKTLLKSGTKQVCPLFHYLFNEVLAKS